MPSARAASQVVDLRPAMGYRAGHIPQARWSIRPRIVAAVADAPRTVVLVADEPGVAGLAALDLAEAGRTDVRLLAGGQEDWSAAGLPVVATPDDPADADCMDFLFFTHGRHEGNAEAARQYLAWEIGLHRPARRPGARRLPHPQLALKRPPRPTPVSNP